MAIYVISVELKNDIHPFDEFQKHLAKYGSTLCIFESTFLLDSKLLMDEISSELDQMLQVKAYFVNKFDPYDYWGWLPESQQKWISDRGIDLQASFIILNE